MEEPFVEKEEAILLDERVQSEGLAGVGSSIIVTDPFLDDHSMVGPTSEPLVLAIECDAGTRAKRKLSELQHNPTTSSDDSLPDPFQSTDVRILDPFPSPKKKHCYTTDESQPPSTDVSSSLSQSDESSLPSSSEADLSSPFNDDPDPFSASASFFTAGPSFYMPQNDAGCGERLFPGSSLSVVQALAILVSWFCSFPGISKEAFSRLMFLLHTFLLPHGNSLPTQYGTAMALLSNFLLPSQEYHCCVNDCIIYRNSGSTMYAHLTDCPVCSEPRFQEGTRTPRKRFKYLPLAPRLERLYGNERTSQLLQCHAIQTSDVKEVITSLHDSDAWSSWYSKEGRFQGDSRALALGLCLDGVNPFAKEKTSYSMWPIIVTPLNLPHHLRIVPGSMMLVGIIPGRSEPRTTDPYLDVLVDDLMELNNLTLHDGLRNERFQLKADIMLHTLDYPGQGKVFHCQGAGAYAGCCYCCTQGEYSHTLQKMVYLGHRSFLPKKDQLHKDKKNFPNKSDPLTTPTPKVMKFVDAANAEYSAAQTAEAKKQIAQRTGCKGPYSLRKLPGHDRFLNTPVEPMHLIKNIAEHIVKLLSGSADSHKVREEERERKRFRASWVESDGSQCHLPPAPFRLQKDELRVANERAVSIKVPFGFGWKPQMIFQQKSFGMKSHEWKQVIATGILKFCIRGLLGKKQRTTLFELCDTIAHLCSEQVSLLELDALESKVHRVLALLERDFPVSLHVVTFHLLHHLPMFLRRFGPVYGYWMYPMERFNSWMTRRALNRRFPESTIIETYRLYEFAYFLQMSGQLPTGALTEPTIADEDLPQNPTVALLEASHLQHLDEYYQEIVPEYHHLIVRYTKERRRAQIKHKLKNFPMFGEWTPKEGPPLTPKEERMRQGPSSEVVKQNFFTFEDKHKRLVRVSSEQSDKLSSNSISSYVYVHYTGASILFGRVCFIFEHTFSDNTSTLAFVHWFDGHSVDFESKLIYVSLDSYASRCPVVSVDQLSKPLLTAVDTCEPHKLWILNFQ